MDTQSDSNADCPADQRDITIRDDKTDFHSLLALVKACRASGGRLRLIDSGMFQISDLEWLGEAGIDIATSNQARRELAEFILMGNAARKGKASASYFHHGPFELKEAPKSVPLSALAEMGRSGIHLYASNAKEERDSSALEMLVRACRDGKARFVYYHHGGLEASLENYCRQGAWIHCLGSSLLSRDDLLLLGDSLAAARAAGSGVILHLERPSDADALDDLFKAGAYLVFQTPPSDYRSLQRALELQAKRRTLPALTFYLFPALML